MSYIDPKEILKGVLGAQQFSASSAAELSKSFNNSISDMSTASSQNASKIIDDIQAVGAKMLESMSHAKKSIDDQVLVHQDRQRRSQPYDFEPDLNDLRPTAAHGYPSEFADEFFSPFLKK